MKKVVFGVLVFGYVIISMFVTGCLLAYNEYQIPEFGKNSLIIINNEKKNLDYSVGSLLVVNKNMDAIKEGTYVFYYDVFLEKATILKAKVSSIDNESSAYLLDNGKLVREDEMIGTVDKTAVFPVFGLILSFLISKWGYLIVIILPVLITFVYEVYQFVLELKSDIGSHKKRVGKRNGSSKKNKE